MFLGMYQAQSEVFKITVRMLDHRISTLPCTLPQLTVSTRTKTCTSHVSVLDLTESLSQCSQLRRPLEGESL